MLMLFSIFILAIKDHDQVDYFPTIHLALGGRSLLSAGVRCHPFLDQRMI